MLCEHALYLRDPASDMWRRVCRKDIPHLKTLSLKCEQLQVCPSCAPWIESCITFECKLPAQAEEQRLLDSLTTPDLNIRVTRLQAHVDAWQDPDATKLCIRGSKKGIHHM